MKAKQSAATAAAWLLAVIALPVLFGGITYFVLSHAYGHEYFLALDLAALAGFAILMDSAIVERTFRESRQAYWRAATWLEMERLLARLVLKYSLLLITFISVFEFTLRKFPLEYALVVTACINALLYVICTTLHNESIYITGQEVMTFAEAKRRAYWRRPFFDAGFPIFPGLVLPTRVLKYGLAVVGAARSGKTVLVRLIMQYAFRPRRTWRQFLGWEIPKRVCGIVYDGKADLAPILLGMQPDAPVYSMNPMDDPKASLPKLGKGYYRCVSWLPSRDIKDPATAETVAPILVPTDPSKVNDPFWIMATKLLVSGVMMALHELKRDSEGQPSWTLADFVRAFEYRADLRCLLKQCEYSSSCLLYLEGGGASADDVMKTVMNYVRQFRTVAALWEQSEKSIGFADWIKDGGILLFPVIEKVRKPADTIYHVLIAIATHCLLGPDAEKNGYTFIFLDEIREAGYLETLNSLLVRGFGKNAITLLAYQSQSGFEFSMTSDKLAAEALGLCQTTIVTRLAEGATGQHMQAEFGESVIWNVVPAQGDQSERRERVTEPAVLASNFSNLQAADPHLGMEAYVKSPEFNGACRAETGPEIFGLLSPTLDIPCVVEPPPEHQYLRRWTAEERVDIGLPSEYPQDKRDKKGKKVFYLEDLKRAQNE